MIATQMYGKPVSELSETEKQTVSTLATVTAGLAGGLAGNLGASAVAGAQSGKTTVENNMLNVIATETAANTAAAIAGATGNASKDTGNDNGWDIGGGCEGSREECAVRDQSRDGIRGPGHVLNGDNPDENKQPNLTNKQIHNYAQQLAGDTPLKEVRPGIYTAKLNNGTSIMLRNLSSSQEQTGARWTIDIRGSQQLAEIAHKYGRQVEIKFR
ncbi:VENN motif pre-toxin domain-containing protein [Escherichia albertii]|nr:VENN motif pre-toxin domain-containing protein [Escherichia albertii]